MERVIGVEPTTLCLASIEGGKINSEAKPSFPLISSYDPSGFYKLLDGNPVPKRPS